MPVSNDGEFRVQTYLPVYIYQPLARGKKKRYAFSRSYLEEGTTHSSVRSIIQTFGQAESRSYETISYCWGDAKKLATITANGRALPVPISSFSALRRVRLIDSFRTVWIDAVCINQNDIDQRE